MTRVALVEALKELCEEAVKEMKLPQAVQKGDTEQRFSVPTVYRMRIPNSRAADKIAPYVIVQLIDSKQQLVNGEPKPKFTATVRFICCVQCNDESVGAIMLLNLMDRLQIHIMKKLQIGKCFLLDVNEPFESVVYTDDTAPYFGGELIGTFQLPPIQQEVNFDFEKQRKSVAGGDCRNHL